MEPLRGDREARLGRIFVELADTLVAEYDVLDFLYLLCERSADVLGVDAVGAMLVDADRGLSLTAASTEEMRVLELFELQRREGPCYDAFATGAAVAEDDLEATAQRWPDFTPQALQAGFRSVYAFPLRLRDDTIGALNMFRRSPGGFDDDDIAAGRALADVATIGIMQERVARESALRSQQLQHALDSRVLIEQAKGLLAERLEASPGEAFQRLRDHARRNRRQLRDVCRDVIDGRLEIT